MSRKTSKDPKSFVKRSKRSDNILDDYFRVRDFEYVQPLYDLAFLLEIEALAKQQDVPKYRTFSLWKAAYSLDGYSTTIDRWLDGTTQAEDLDYIPSTRIAQYLKNVNASGTIPELKLYSGKKYARCLRLRALRGLGPAQIAQTLSSNSLLETWLNQAVARSNADRSRIISLFNGNNPGPWQTAHVVPPLLRFLRSVELAYNEPLEWSIAGIEDPFEPITKPVVVSVSKNWALLQAAFDQALKQQKHFESIKQPLIEKKQFNHQMGWSFSIVSKNPTSSFNNISTLRHLLDPIGTETPTQLVSDLHLHTAWSDGSASVNTMAQAITQRGLKFFAVTDHSRTCKLQGGLTPVLWLRQANALTLANPVCPVLHGIEVDILKDGSLDLPHSLLQAADLVIGSVHSSWSSESSENTRRLIKAIETGCIDIIAHPTSAVIGKPGVPDYLRSPAAVNWNEVFERCAKWGVALELNCFPSRLDLPLPLLRKAIKAGCAISLGSDAHARSHLINLQFGESALSKLPTCVVLNRLPYDELINWIQEQRGKRRSLTKTTITFVQPELHFNDATESKQCTIFAQIQPPQHIPSGSRIVGIDLTAGDKATGVAILGGFDVKTLSLTTDEEILSYVREQKPEIVSIDSPLGLPGGGFEIDPKAGIVRVAEHDLASVGIPAYPALIDSMKNLTLRGIRLKNAIEAFPNAPRVIESYPGAAQDILCIPRKQKSLDLLREGLSRLGLKGEGLATRSHDEMDAITSAIVGRYFESGDYEPMGIPSEAQLIVPKVYPLQFDQNPVICLAGKTGVGKSVVARYLSVFYGFHWVRTRDLIRELYTEHNPEVDQNDITEQNLRDFGAVVLDQYQQVPLRNKLAQTILQLEVPLVIDSIRDILDVDPETVQHRPIFIWFIDCNDSIIRSRLEVRIKKGVKKPGTGSPVDRTALDIQNKADLIIPNQNSLEDLRWRVDDALFSHIEIKRSYRAK